TKRAAQPDGCRHGHEARDDEVHDLDPTQVAVGQETPGVLAEVEAVARERLRQRDTEVQRAGENAVAEQGPGDPVGRGAVGCGVRGHRSFLRSRSLPGPRTERPDSDSALQYSLRGSRSSSGVSVARSVRTDS